MDRVSHESINRVVMGSLEVRNVSIRQTKRTLQHGMQNVCSRSNQTHNSNNGIRRMSNQNGIANEIYDGLINPSNDELQELNYNDNRRVLNNQNLVSMNVE